MVMMGGSVYENAPHCNSCLTSGQAEQISSGFNKQAGVGVAPTNDGTNNTVIIPYTPGNRFFRLKWP